MHEHITEIDPNIVTHECGSFQLLTNFVALDEELKDIPEGKFECSLARPHLPAHVRHIENAELNLEISRQGQFAVGLIECDMNQISRPIDNPDTFFERLRGYLASGARTHYNPQVDHGDREIIINPPHGPIAITAMFSPTDLNRVTFVVEGMTPIDSADDAQSVATAWGHVLDYCARRANQRSRPFSGEQKVRVAIGSLSHQISDIEHAVLTELGARREPYRESANPRWLPEFEGSFDSRVLETLSETAGLNPRSIGKVAVEIVDHKLMLYARYDAEDSIRQMDIIGAIRAYALGQSDPGA